MTTPPTSTPWVPMWPLAAPAGAGSLAYRGDWVAGTYQDGDVVVKDGVAFMAVGGPTSDVPSTVPWGLASTVASYGTSLPASPVDGQEAILVDSLTAPTYSWRFRYVASITDAYKWVCVGGTHGVVAISNIVNSTGGSIWVYSGLMTVMNAGIWDYALEAVMAAPAARLGYWGYAVGGVTGGDIGIRHLTMPAGVELPANLSQRVTVATQFATLQLAHLMDTQPATFYQPYLRYRPVRIAG